MECLFVHTQSQSYSKYVYSIPAWPRTYRELHDRANINTRRLSPTVRLHPYTTSSGKRANTTLLPVLKPAKTTLLPVLKPANTTLLPVLKPANTTLLPVLKPANT